MFDFEKLGAFYAGRRIDQDKNAETDELVLYDSRDLTTHAVIIGMTGSGKTGLGIGLIEEAALDHIPVIAIDPKGDMANLMLTFPDLSGEDFKPWVNARQATDAGQSVDEFAAAQAALWKKGLKDWGQDGKRIQTLKDSAEFHVFTPGSNAATPISVLDTFAAPDAALRDDAELQRERVQATVTGLLALIDIDADPLTSREHILLSQILDHSWSAGKDLDIAKLIGEIQSPPVSRVGVLDLESFYPEEKRFELAMRLNNLLAAPGFASWMEGVPLSAQGLFYTEDGKPRVSILSIAHLSDDERMFFVTMLLTEIIGWMRAQQGTSSLRAILYMDEIFGYLPPTAKPPSKKLFLTLLKQARAYGLGLVLSTQNPVDLDYKALSNAGTWFIGRLQTERDKARVMEGLEGVSSGKPFDKGETERTLAGLGKRRFLLHNVHEDEDVVFSTRWVMSYLAGPMTRDQIARLAKDQQPYQAKDDASAAQKSVDADAAAGGAAPVVPPAIEQCFAPALHDSVVYYPRLLTAAEFCFSNARYGVDTPSEERLYTLEASDDSAGVEWDAAEPMSLEREDLETHAREAARYAECPGILLDAKRYKGWEREFKSWFRQHEQLVLLRSKKYRLNSEAGESEGDFRTRLQIVMNEKRDTAIAKVRKRYASKANTLENRLLRAEQRIESEQEQATASKLKTAVSFGTAILGAVLGRKRLSSTTANKVGTAIRTASSARKQSGDVARARETAAQVQADLEALNVALEEEVEALEGSYDAQAEELDERVVRVKTTDLRVPLVGLIWLPYADEGEGRLKPAWRE